MTLTAQAPRQLDILDDEAGFHGDLHILKLVDYLMGYAEAFIETGTYMAQTATYVARNYPEIPLFTCEPDPKRYADVRAKLVGYPQARAYNQFSPEFLQQSHTAHPELCQQTNLYWLDAHGFGFDNWPLRQEVEFITRNVSNALILIDDFRVPERPEFAFDAYKGQACALEYIADSMHTGRTYYVIYPTYREKTSKVHGLRGVGLILYDVPGFYWPDQFLNCWQAFEMKK
ncbi:MAG TPA: hypothetical protein VGG19_05860 [Tepidisphaeraceae bacterium]|jgi:hypothetical protein